MKNNKADLMFKEGFSARTEFVFDLRMNQSALSDLGTDREKASVADFCCSLWAPNDGFFPLL